MKSERRHELKTNTLALALQRLPEKARQYGGQILLGLVLLVLIIILIFQQLQRGGQELRVAGENLAIARSAILQLQNFPAGPFGPEQRHQILADVRELVFDAEQAIDQAARASTDPLVQAEAMIAQGDLYWQLATLPPIPAPEEAEPDPLDDRQALMQTARESYQVVLNDYPDQTLSVVSARFGLAAISENEQDWPTARQHYQAILDKPEVAVILRDQAEHRLELLAQLQQPRRLGQPRPVPMPEDPFMGMLPMEMPPMPAPGEVEQPAIPGAPTGPEPVLPPAEPVEPVEPADPAEPAEPVEPQDDPAEADQPAEVDEPQP